MIKRLFFGTEVHAPWPESLPKGRMLNPAHRHVTLAFLGDILFSPRLEQAPRPQFKIGKAGHFNACLKLSHVMAWQMEWWDESIKEYQHTLSDWLKLQGYTLDTREWNPHLTLCREPFNRKDWEISFKPLPFYTSAIHLYESVGNLEYIPIWTHPILAPFEEFDHTADMAFKVRGKTIEELYHNAFTALSFKEPAFLELMPQKSVKTLDDLVIGLNQIIARIDGTIGCPFKAVSFHGKIIPEEDYLTWEMIVDV